MFTTHRLFRIAIIGCAALFGLQATWLIVPEMSRPTAAGDPSVPAESEDRRAAAERAARFAVIRGDLWAELALTYSGLVWSDGRSISRRPTRQSVEEARAIAAHALSHSPHDARVWLLLAALNNLTEDTDRHTAAALKMSYYTGPNEIKLIPLRLLVAVRPGVLADEELQDLFRYELGSIISRKPELKPAIVAAYREATPAARRLIEEEAVSHRDEQLLAMIRSGAGAR